MSKTFGMSSYAKNFGCHENLQCAEQVQSTRISTSSCFFFLHSLLIKDPNILWKKKSLLVANRISYFLSNWINDLFLIFCRNFLRQRKQLLLSGPELKKVRRNRHEDVRKGDGTNGWYNNYVMGRYGNIVKMSKLWLDFILSKKKWILPSC